MLGVGRSIDTRRKRIAGRDVEGLRSLACERHAAVRRHFEEVREGVYPAAGLAAE